MPVCVIGLHTTRLYVVVTVPGSAHALTINGLTITSYPRMAHSPVWHIARHGITLCAHVCMSRPRQRAADRPAPSLAPCGAPPGLSLGGFAAPQSPCKVTLCAAKVAAHAAFPRRRSAPACLAVKEWLRIRAAACRRVLVRMQGCAIGLIALTATRLAPRPQLTPLHSTTRRGTNGCTPAYAGVFGRCQYSCASMMVSTRTVCFGSAGFSLPCIRSGA